MIRRSLLVLLALCATPAFATSQVIRTDAPDAQRMEKIRADGPTQTVQTEAPAAQETTITPIREADAAQAIKAPAPSVAYRLSVVEHGRVIQTATLLVPNGGSANFDLTRSYPYRKAVTQTLSTDPSATPEVPTTQMDAVTDGLKVTLTRYNDVLRVLLDQSTLEGLASFTSGEATIDLPQRRVDTLVQSLVLQAGESFSYPIYHRPDPRASANLLFGPRAPTPVSPEAELPVDRTVTLTRLGEADQKQVSATPPGLYQVTFERQRQNATERLGETLVAARLGTATPLTFIQESTYLKSSQTEPTQDGGTLTTMNPATVRTGLDMELKVAQLNDQRAQLLYTFRGTALASVAVVTQTDGNLAQRPQVTVPFEGAGSLELAVGDSHRVALNDHITATIKRLN